MHTLLGLVILIGDIWAIVEIAGSRRQPLHKLLWIVAILLLPLLGLLAYVVAGRALRRGRWRR